MSKVLVLILVLFCSNVSAAPPRNAELGVNFVGSQACAACHRDLYDSFKKTSMGQSLTEVSPGLKSRFPTTAQVQSSTAGHSYRVYWERNRLYQSESVVDENGKRTQGPGFPSDFAVGSGVNGVTFLIRRENRLFEAPLSYYSRTRSWDLSPGFAAYDAGFTRPVQTACLECHIGRFASGVQAGNSFPMRPFAEPAIGCESCHGPGEIHVRERGAGHVIRSADDSIVNPARLPQELANDICVRCHQGNDARVPQIGKSVSDFRPGTPLSHALVIFKLPLRVDQPGQQPDLLEHGFAMTLSKCFRRSGSMTCTTCHSVHQSIEPAQKVSYYRSKCLTCHSTANCRLEISKRPGDDCISCHMPKRPVEAVAHSALTNHRIVLTPDEPYPDDAHDSQGNGSLGLIRFSGTSRPAVHDVNDIVLLQAYRSLLPKAPWLRGRYEALLGRLQSDQPNDPTVLSTAGHELVISGSHEGSEQAIGLLKRSVAGGDQDSEVSLDLATALLRTSRSQEAVEVLKKAVAHDSFDPTLRKLLIETTMRTGDQSESVSEMTDYLRLFPTDQSMRTLLNEVRMTMGLR